jgi:hypothetical protein
MDEDKWMTGLEKSVEEMMRRKELCELLGVSHHPRFNSLSYHTFEERLIFAIRKTKEYGLELKPSYVTMNPKALSAHLSKLNLEKERIGNRKSLTNAANHLNITLHDLNVLRLRGLVTYILVGRTFYFEMEQLKQELKQEKVQEYFRENKRNYQIN